MIVIINKSYVLVVNFWIKVVNMATSHLITSRHIPHFGLKSLISTLSFGESFSYFNYCHVMEIILPTILNR